MERPRNDRRRLRRVALATGCLAVTAGVLWAFRGNLPWADARPVNPSPASPALSTPSAPAQAAQPAEPVGDYATRVVAYINQNVPVTRQELGEYLIARHGVDKLPVLLNRRIIDRACRLRGVDVTPTEVDVALADELKGLKLDLTTFVKTVLPRYKKNLIEWKEDVLRLCLLLTRLCQKQVTCSEEELRKAFEGSFGEKIECRMIVWPPAAEKQAAEQYATLRDSEKAFDEAARKQPTSSLAAAAGKIKPFGRHSMGDEEMEREAFALRPGEVSKLIKTSQGHVLLRCDRRIPADTTVSFEAVRARLTTELTENKVQAAMAGHFQVLRDEARPQPLLKKVDSIAPGGSLPSPTAVVGYLHGKEPVTREELGEFLIARFGAEKLELLVNRRIIDDACKAKNLRASDEAVEVGLQADLKMLNVDRTGFEKDVLAKWGKTLAEWREDVVRPRILLGRLAEGRATCTEEDIRKGYEAYYGEKIEVRLILWPSDQARFAVTEYERIRSSEEEFDRKARAQASPSLASTGGRIPPVGRNTLGDEALEREIFKLSPGEVSILVGTPQGQVVARCDRRIPASKDVTLDSVRDRITREVMEKKSQAEMQLVFKELRDAAAPRLMLKDANRPDDLVAETKHLLGQ